MQTLLLLLVLYKTNWNKEVSERANEFMWEEGFFFSFFNFNEELLNDECRLRKLQEGCSNGLDRKSEEKRELKAKRAAFSLGEITSSLQTFCFSFFILCFLAAHFLISSFHFNFLSRGV